VNTARVYDLIPEWPIPRFEACQVPGCVVCAAK
jgi:hypothetical protein